MGGAHINTTELLCFESHAKFRKKNERKSYNLKMMLYISLKQLLLALSILNVEIFIEIL